jgi:hypothetical protein
MIDVTSGTDNSGTSLFIYDVGLFNDAVCGASYVVRLHTNWVFEDSYVVVVPCVCGASQRFHLLLGKISAQSVLRARPSFTFTANRTSVIHKTLTLTDLSQLNLYRRNQTDQRLTPSNAILLVFC